MKFNRLLLAIQGVYIGITAVWPLVHIDSFLYVTGPKHDIWLVKTVGALLLPIAICLGVSAGLRKGLPLAGLLASMTAVSFCIIDFYYSLTDVISDIYMLDGIVEMIFLGCWIKYFLAASRDKSRA